METLPEALGLSTEQRQPPESLHKAVIEKNRGEEFGPSPTALRPRPKCDTLMTQNEQPFFKGPLPPFIDKGREGVTMWDKYPPYFPMYISYKDGRASQIANSPFPPNFYS